MTLQSVLPVSALPARALDKPRVLLVDDELPIRVAFARNLRAAGYDATTASDGPEALAAFERRPFDVVISDLGLPAMNGLDLLSAIRAIDPEAPFILITAGATLDTALHAIEGGALRYLRKPVPFGELDQAVRAGLQVRNTAALKRQAITLLGAQEKLVSDRRALDVAFEAALASLTMAYQPIIRWGARDVVGYEALMRSREASLPSPVAVLDAAEKLERTRDIGRCVRRLVAEDARIDPAASFFVNLHPLDLLDDELFAPTAPLSRIASRVTLEITERASLEKIRDVRARLAALRALGYRIALDDLGSGYAGLTSFAVLEPDVVKLDMALVRDVDSIPTKQKLVRAMVSLTRDMGMLLVAEGVETAAERDMLLSLGCDALQGYLFARPGPAFPRVVR